MTKEKALEIVKTTLAAKDANNVVYLKDGLIFRIAITILSKNYTTEELKDLLN